MAGTRKNTTRNQNNRSRSYSNSKSRTTRNSKNSYQKSNRNTSPIDPAIRNEIILIALLAVCIVLFLCNFGVIGVVGNQISGFLFGMFGLLAYIVPVFFFFMITFGMVNSGNSIATRKIIAGICLFLFIGIICELLTGRTGDADSYQLKLIYEDCRNAKNGGGIISGSLAYLCYRLLGVIGTVLLILVGGVISVVVLTDKSFVSGVKAGGKKVYERTREDAEYRRARAIERREELEEERQRAREEKRIHEEELENERILRMDKKVSGVMINTALSKEEAPAEEKVRDDMHEINLQDFDDQVDELSAVQEVKKNQSYFTYNPQEESDALFEVSASYDEPEEIEESAHYDHNFLDDQNEYLQEDSYEQEDSYVEFDQEEIIEPIRKTETVSEPVTEVVRTKPIAKPAAKSDSIFGSGTVRGSSGAVGTTVTGEMYEKLHEKHNNPPKREYIFPSLNLLKKGINKAGDSKRELNETAERLRQTLANFGVKVTITEISQGPAVTRYELQPEQGVKVSKIVGLTDDIKLNLAATDIRIEAPIPGKAAIGIEVPNKENSAVALRDLLESQEFQKFESRLAFAVGKDIGGKTVVADIGKMPHMLIAGATGSGKSVCINTLIMSIIYKAKPEEVKMIMIDPKVVELSVYNGIPHLLIPVVTDPKKAAGALHWGVAEMTDRYQKFAEMNVRDLKGYNKKLEELQAKGEMIDQQKMPQIVIIVDELADLMMVAPGEVEESICRLAQLARAAGIHLIIATQRPSVDVITGLIKANMPSRVAFSVSSGVDSRTILDMNGAEKLLGKGDMLFYPQGYTKPARVQGAFVSDKEVSDVVEFLKNQRLGNVYSDDIQEKISSLGTGGNNSSQAGSSGASDLDEYFVDAGKFIIDKDKASIGMLQRVFKIGFNRAARIMDQLCEAGVVGEEEGTKPRKVLMSLEQFEQYIEESI